MYGYGLRLNPWPFKRANLEKTVPGRLHHSAADILRYLLIDLTIAGDPADSPLPTWPAYAHMEPGTPDDVITVFDTSAMQQGRVHNDGERQEREGFQVRIRATLGEEGYNKADEIKTAFDQDVYQRTVTIGAYSYLVHAISRTTGIIALGTEPAVSKRSLFTINGTVSVREVS